MKPGMKKDPYTQEEFWPKRSNQVYAKRQNQIDSNNNKAGQINKLKRPTQQILNSNYKILKRILGTQKSVVVTEEFLHGAQFDFCYFTATVPADAGNGEIYLIFDYALLKLENKKYQIQKND